VFNTILLHTKPLLIKEITFLFRNDEILGFHTHHKLKFSDARNFSDIYKIRLQSVSWLLPENKLEITELHNEMCFRLYICVCYTAACGPGSSVGIATDYGLDGPGSNPGGDEIFHPSRPTLEPTQPPVQWVPGLSQG